MAVAQLLVISYAKNIIQHGNRTFATIAPDYVQPVKQYIADNHTQYEIDIALVKGYISQDEYDEILSMRTSAE